MQVWYSFTHTGFVQVRENQYQGEYLSFPDKLNMNTWGNVSLFFRNQLKPGLVLTSYLSWYHTSGRTTLPYSFYYNGTLIDGTSGVNIAPTIYIRMRVDITHYLINHKNLKLGSKSGLVYDNMTFYVKGDVAPGSPRNEPVEFFGRQAIPFPYLGANFDYQVSRRSNINVALFGTYIPKFKSFFREGGRMSIKYAMTEASLDYTYAINQYKVGLGYKYSYLRHLEESSEDTNRFKISASGININITYTFPNR